MIAALAPLVLQGAAIDRETGDAILGDLLEEHAQRAAERGTWHAELWLARQLLRSFPHFHALGPRAAGCGDMAGMARRFYGGFAIVVITGLASGLAALAGWRAVDARLVAATALPASSVAGYLVARLVRRAPLLAALAIGVVAAAVLAGALLRGDAAPSVVRLLTLFAFPLAAVVGGLLRARDLA